MTYEEIVAQVRRRPDDVDFSEFRLAFTRTDAYNPYGMEPFEEDEAIDAAAQRSDWAEVLARASAALERCYVRVAPHLYSGAACKALRDPVGQRHHELCAQALLASVMTSGDGRTLETAFVVIGVWEEYDLLNALGLQTVRQALVPVGEQSVDHMTVVAGVDSESFDLYFDVTIPMTISAGRSPGNT
jgi:hypothetical protein